MDALVGKRKLIAYAIGIVVSATIALINRKVGIGVTGKDVMDAIAAISASFMIGNGLEHIGNGIARRKAMPASPATMVQPPPVLP